MLAPLPLEKSEPSSIVKWGSRGIAAIGGLANAAPYIFRVNHSPAGVVVSVLGAPSVFMGMLRSYPQYIRDLPNLFTRPTVLRYRSRYPVRYALKMLIASIAVLSKGYVSTMSARNLMGESVASEIFSWVFGASVLLCKLAELDKFILSKGFWEDGESLKSIVAHLGAIAYGINTTYTYSSEILQFAGIKSQAGIYSTYIVSGGSLYVTTHIGYEPHALKILLNTKFTWSVFKNGMKLAHRYFHEHVWKRCLFKADPIELTDDEGKQDYWRIVTSFGAELKSLPLTLLVYYFIANLDFDGSEVVASIAALVVIMPQIVAQLSLFNDKGKTDSELLSDSSDDYDDNFLGSSISCLSLFSRWTNRDYSPIDGEEMTSHFGKNIA